jgi:hypothetical protein
MRVAVRRSGGAAAAESGQRHRSTARSTGFSVLLASWPMRTAVVAYGFYEDQSGIRDCRIESTGGTGSTRITGHHAEVLQVGEELRP